MTEPTTRISAGNVAETSPLARADDAKRRRDLAGELDALMQADQDLEAQPWHPLQPGDVVLCAFPPLGPDDEPYGETYVAMPGEDTDVAGNPMLQLVSASSLEPLGASTGEEDQAENGPEQELPARAPFYDLWFEAGASLLTVIRAGRIVHGRPVR